MTQGGARARSGPAPDPNALRRERDSGDWVHLPAEGRLTEPPPWPLSRPSGRELALWLREWRRPQALMWERNGQTEEVALYCRSLKDAEKAKASVASRTLVRQQQESLGLSLPGLHRNRWLIADVPAASTPRKPASVTDMRSRLKAVASG